MDPAVIRGCRATALILAATLAALPADAAWNRVALRWLAQDCGVTDRDAIDRQLRDEGLPAVRTLRRISEEGPPGAVKRTTAREARRSYRTIQTAVLAGRTYGLSGSVIDQIRATTRDQFVERALKRLDREYRMAAMAGLAVVGFPEGIAFLRSTAKDPESAYMNVARDVLAEADIPLDPP